MVALPGGLVAVPGPRDVRRGDLVQGAAPGASRPQGACPVGGPVLGEPTSRADTGLVGLFGGRRPAAGGTGGRVWPRRLGWGPVSLEPREAHTWPALRRRWGLGPETWGRDPAGRAWTGRLAGRGRRLEGTTASYRAWPIGRRARVGMGPGAGAAHWGPGRRRGQGRRADLAQICAKSRAFAGSRCRAQGQAEPASGGRPGLGPPQGRHGA